MVRVVVVGEVGKDNARLLPPDYFYCLEAELRRVVEEPVAAVQAEVFSVQQGGSCSCLAFADADGCGLACANPAHAAGSQGADSDFPAPVPQQLERARDEDLGVIRVGNKYY